MTLSESEKFLVKYKNFLGLFQFRLLYKQIPKVSTKW